MLLNLDICIIILILILVLLVLSGFFSLAERKILAIVQMRIGPALFLFGLLTPITDGIKLFLKFALFVVNVDSIYFIGGLFIAGYCMYFIWFFLPLGFIVLFDNCLSVLILLTLHTLGNVFSVLLVGCFLFTSCFVYLAAMRVLFFSIISEAVILILYFSIYALDYFSFFTIKDICVNQIFISNWYVLGVLYVAIFWVCMLLDGLRLPFDYMECESELVSGVITELSGVFFIFYSLSEMNHTTIAAILFSCFCFGGLFISFKALILIIFAFLWPRVLGMRLKVTTAQTFILLFLFVMCLLIFFWLIVTKIICLLF